MGITTVLLTRWGRGFLPQFCKCLVTACYMPGTALSDGDTSVNKLKFLTSWSLYSREERQAITTQISKLSSISEGEKVISDIGENDGSADTEFWKKGMCGTK